MCVTILDSPHATDIEKKLAGICLLRLDECESLRAELAELRRHYADAVDLRKDKERLMEQVEAFRSFMETEMGWEYFRAEMMYFDNEKKEGCSLENARKLKNFLTESRAAISENAANE